MTATALAGAFVRLLFVIGTSFPPSLAFLPPSLPPSSYLPAATCYAGTRAFGLAAPAAAYLDSFYSAPFLLIPNLLLLLIKPGDDASAATAEAAAAAAQDAALAPAPSVSHEFGALNTLLLVLVLGT